MSVDVLSTDALTEQIRKAADEVREAEDALRRAKGKRVIDWRGSQVLAAEVKLRGLLAERRRMEQTS